MKRQPTFPERIVRRLHLEEVRDLVGVIWAEARTKQMAKLVKRRVTEAIGMVEHRKPVLLDAAPPELVHAGRLQALGRRVPEPEV